MHLFNCPAASRNCLQGGGIPGQPDPDIPDQPARPDLPPAPGEPTIPDQPPPAPVAHR